MAGANDSTATPLTGRAVLEWFWHGCRRRPLVAGLCAALALALLIGVAAVFWQWRRAEADLATARAESRRAEKGLAAALDAVDRFYTQISQVRLLNEPGMDRVRKELLETARDFYTRFVREHRGDPNARLRLERTLLRLALIQQELGAARAAFDLLSEAVAMQEKLLGERPDDVAVQLDYGKSLHHLAVIQASFGRLPEAEALYIKILGLSRRFGVKHPERPEGESGVALASHNLGLLYSRSGRLSQAGHAFRRTLTASERLARRFPKDPAYRHNQVRTWINLAWAYWNQGRQADGDKAFQTGFRLARNLVRDYPKVADYRTALTGYCRTAGERRLSMAASATAGAAPPLVAEAVPFIDEALTLQRQLVREDPGVSAYRHDLAVVLIQLGVAHQVAGRPSRAEACFREALAVGEGLARDKPTLPANLVSPVTPRLCLALLQTEQGRPEAALERCAEASGELERLSPSMKRVYQLNFWALGLNRAYAHWERGQYREAVAAWDQVLAADAGSSRHLWRFARAVAQARATGTAASREYRTLYEKAVAEAAPLRPLLVFAGESPYWLAMVYALGAAAAADDDRLPADQRSRRAERHAATAVALLAHARNSGWFRVAGRRQRLEKDPEFAALRNRADFRTLLASLQSKDAD
jgi:tetratricopeptide (TPR) repeat protein